MPNEGSDIDLVKGNIRGRNGMTASWKMNSISFSAATFKILTILLMFQIKYSTLMEQLR
jgi:hypothetical protein